MATVRSTISPDRVVTFGDGAMVTGTGKIRHAKAWRGHNRHSKSGTRWRRVAGESTLQGKDAKRAARLLGR